MAVPFSALQAIAPSAVIELFQLELNTTQHGVNETYYFHPDVNLDGSGDVVWNGQAYIRFPIEATDFEYSGNGQLPRPKLRVSNILGTITALILTLPNGIEGAKVTRIRTLARYLDAVNFPGGTNPYGTPDPTAEFPREIYYIDRKATENRDVIEFELAAAFDLVGVRAPKRQCVSNVCQWKYRGPECGYVGNAYFNANDQPVGALAQDVCGKRLRSCELRFSQQRFFGSVTAGSNIITLAQPVSISSGDPVSGFGLPGGTVVSSVNNNLVTVNQNSSASTAVVTTGTIQSNYTQIVVSSAAGIVPGMNVTGAYLPANCQVVGVSGTTITLSAPVDPAQFFVSTGSATGTIPQTRGRNEIYFPIATSLTVGRFIASSLLPLSYRAVITGIRTSTIRQGKFVYAYKIAQISIAVNSGKSVVWTSYQETGIPSATYSFSATNAIYTFRADGNLPYGSYPGVGQYTA